MKMSERDDATVPPNLRLKAFLACEALLRLMREAVAHYEDLECAVVYFAVIAASVNAATRDPDVVANLQEPVPEVLFRPVSRRAVAQSTGLPRETVRRKIARLVEEGHLLEEGRGVRPPHNVLMARSNYAFADALVQELTRIGDRLSRL